MRLTCNDDMQAAVEAVLATVLAHMPDGLDAQARVLDALISALCLELVRVQARIGACAAVGRLADDVLAQIFAFACREPPRAPYAATSATAAAIAGTCRRWRAVAIGQPALWTRVDLRHPSAPHALRYSRRLGLSVRLDAPRWKDARDTPLARVLAPHVGRVRQLWIQTAAPHASAFLRAIAAPCPLERLVVAGRYTDEAPVVLPAALVPRLRHLALTHAHLAPPLPAGLVSLALTPSPAAPPTALAALTALLRASPGLTDLALAAAAVPVYTPGDPPGARADLPRLRSLRVSGGNPVQTAWLLFHLSYPASALLTLEMEASRPLRTAECDHPRPPGELESYLAVLTMFRSGALPLDAILVHPAASEHRPGLVHTPQQTTEKLVAQYTTASSTLTLQAGSRATEVLARLVSTPLVVTKLVLSAVELRLGLIEPLPPDAASALSHIRTLEIRACSLAHKADMRQKSEPTGFSTPAHNGPRLGPQASRGTNPVISSNPYSTNGFPSGTPCTTVASPMPANMSLATPGPHTTNPASPLSSEGTTAVPTSDSQSTAKHETDPPHPPESVHSASAGATSDSDPEPTAEDETDSNEADGGSELEHSSDGEDPNLTTITERDESEHDSDSGPESAAGDDRGRQRLRVCDRPGTPGPSRSRPGPAAPTGSGGVNGATTPRTSGMSTPLVFGSGTPGTQAKPLPGAAQAKSAPNAGFGSQLPEQSKSSAYHPHVLVHNLRSSFHSASMSNLCSASTGLGLGMGAGTGMGHSASSSNLREAFGTFGRSQSANANLAAEGKPKQSPTAYGFASYATAAAAAGFGTAANGTTRPQSAQQRSSSLPTTQSSFHTFRTAAQTRVPPREDPDIRLLSALSFHMPMLEEVRIVRSTIRGNTLVKFIQARNNPGLDDEHAYDHDHGHEDDHEGDSSDDSDLGLEMAKGTRKKVRAGPGTPILMLELVECPYVNAEHVRVLREIVDDVRWRPFTLVGGI